MENQKITEGTKLILLKASKMILRMKQKSLDIISERKLYHTKLIERSSKCTKDPNPLATTMILMNQKYPIALSRNELRKYGIPRALLSSDSSRKEIEDTHKHDRLLARLSTIDWWIEHSPVPDDKLMRLADVLFASLDNNVTAYYEADWKSSGVKWGPPMLQRKLIRTQKPLVDIPTSLRSSAIKEVFFPDYCIPNPSLPTATVRELKDKVAVRLEDNIPLTKQIRIILNAMDPKERYLPILPSSGENTVQMKHAIVHNNLVVTGYIREGPTEHKEWVNSFRNLLGCIIYEGKNAKIPAEDLKEVCLASTISNVSFTTMLESVMVSDSIEFLWARALFEKSTTLEHKRGNLTVCPDPREGRDVAIYNKRGVSRISKMGNQVVNFKYGDMRGKYVYNGQMLIEIVSTYTTIRDLTSVLKEVAKHINYRFQETRDMREQANDRMIEKMIDTAPYKFLDCRITQFSTIGTLRPGQNCGKFRHQPDSEYVTTGCYQVTLDERLDILLPGTRLTIPVSISRNSLSSLSSDVICKSHLMINHFNIKETIKEMFYYYLRNVETLMERVKSKMFTWKNHYVRKFLGGSAKQMSLMARSMISQISDEGNTNMHYICFLYCFCYNDPKGAQIGSMTYCLPDGTIIDMSAEKGIFVYSEKENSYLLYGMKVARSLRRIGRSELLSGILEGYKIIYPANENNKIVSVRSLETGELRIEEGEGRNTYIGGALYTVIKDSSVSYSTQATLNRQMEEVLDRIKSQGKNVILGKRWLECEELDFEHFSAAKKKKKMDEENVEFEYSEDVIIGDCGEDMDLDDIEYDSENDI